MDIVKKFLLCILIGCISGVLSDHLPDNFLDGETKECMEKLGIDTETVRTAFDEHFHVKYPNDVTTKVSECYLDKVKIFNEDGEFNRDLILERFAKQLPIYLKNEIDHEKALEMTAKFFDACSHTTGENLIEKIVKLNNCFLVELEKLATS